MVNMPKRRDMLGTWQRFSAAEPFSSPPNARVNPVTIQSSAANPQELSATNSRFATEPIRNRFQLEPEAREDNLPSYE